MQLNPLQLLGGLLLSALIGWLAYRRGSLTRSGWLGAVLTGTLTFGFGGLACGVALVVFFVTSSALSKYRQAQKERIAGEKFEKGGRRDLLQALANGGAAALLALAYGLSGGSLELLAAFAGVLATVTADTWATELGVLSTRPPLLITSMRPTAPGTSGGVSGLGMAASAAGALTIGATIALALGLSTGTWEWRLPVAALVGGVAGSLCDSLLGATLQAIYQSPSGETERHRATDGAPNTLVRGWPWMNNDMVNFLSSLAGGAVAWALFLAV